MRYSTFLLSTVVVTLLTLAGCGGGRIEEKNELKSPLFSAVNEGDLEKVKSVLDSGADVNQKDEKGRTALHLAVDYDDVEMIELLAKHGADFSITNFSGDTPLEWAEARDKNAAAQACYELAGGR